MTTPSTYPEQLLAQTAWLQRLSRELVPNAHSADLAQETLAAALARPQPVRANVRTWLERIARNLAAGGTRSHYRRLRRERDAVRSGEEPSTADTLAQFEMHRSVVDAVQTLRDPIRTTLLLRFWEDLPPREISKRMNAPVETVRTRIKRGLQELRGSLDAQHGRREAWCVPLLALSTGRGAVIAPASFTVAAIGLLMQTKILAFSAIAVVGLIAAFAWNAGNDNLPDIAPSTDTPQVATASAGTAKAAVVQADPGHSSVTADRALVVADAKPAAAWMVGTVTDSLSAPIVDVEVGLLTESEADKYGNHITPRPTGIALQILRTRWALWDISDNGLMRKKAILGEVFGTELVTRTDMDGSFRFRRDTAESDMVLAVWSPDVGLRFQTVTAPQSPQHFICESWPRIRGHVTSVAGELTKPVRVTVDYGARGGRVLQFETNALGDYVTPQIPPDNHTVGFRVEGHHGKKEQFDLIDEVTLATELVPFARLHMRLVDTAGLLLDRQRFATRGWVAEELRFLLLREDLQNESELGAVLHTSAPLQYSPERGSLQGAVEDPEALVLSVWRDRERIAAALLPDHTVTEVAIDVPGPKLATNLEVNVALDTQTSDAFVHLELGAMVGLGGYNFKSAAKAEGPPERFRLEVPGFLRGQTGRLIVRADGFATQFVEVPIPDEGAPRTLWLTMAVADLTLVGTVVNEKSEPVAGARVKIATVDGRAFRILPDTVARTDAAGEFRFTNLTPGNVRLFLSGREFASTSALAVVDSKAPKEPVTIRVQPGVTRTFEFGPAGDRGLALRVLDVHGAPLMDDRLFGAMHGRTTRIRLTPQAHRLEAWHVRATEPAVTIDLK